MDIDTYVEKNKILQVRSTRMEGRGGKLDPDGLFSEEIWNSKDF